MAQHLRPASGERQAQATWLQDLGLHPVHPPTPNTQPATTQNLVWDCAGFTEGFQGPWWVGVKGPEREQRRSASEHMGS